MKERKGKLALLIDGVKFHATAKALGFEIDYKKMLEVFGRRGNLLRAFYCTPILDDLEFCTVRPLVDWLDYNGYMVLTKPVKEFIDSTGRRRIKANTDVDLAVCAMDVADQVDEIVLCSGDGGFRPLVAALQRRGVRVTVVSTLVSELIADELRRQADIFIDLADLKPQIARAAPHTTVEADAVIAIQRRPDS